MDNDKRVTFRALRDPGFEVDSFSWFSMARMPSVVNIMEHWYEGFLFQDLEHFKTIHIWHI